MRKHLPAIGMAIAIGAAGMAIAADAAHGARQNDEPVVTQPTVEAPSPDWEIWLKDVRRFERDMFDVICWYYTNGTDQEQLSALVIGMKGGLTADIIEIGCTWLQEHARINHTPSSNPAR